jgi:Transglutaminase-like superfamily
MVHAKNSLTNDADSYLESTEYLDADHPLLAALAEKLTHGAESDVERIWTIYLYVRDLRYDVLESFRYLAAGQRSASAVLEHGVAFCMGKASSFVRCHGPRVCPRASRSRRSSLPKRSSCRRRFGHYGAANAVGRCHGIRWGKPS